MNRNDQHNMQHDLTRRKVLGAGLGLTLVGTSLSARAQASVPTLRVAYAQGTQANFYHALQNGLFAKHGVKLEGTKFDSGPALVSALVAGSVDVGYFGLPAVINANSNGAKLQVFSLANIAGKMAALYVNPKSGIKGVKDLVGKTVATTQNTVGHIFMLIAMKQAGVDPKSVNIRFIDPNGLVAGYVRGDLEAIWMFASVGAKLMSNGATLIPSTSAQAIGLEDAGQFIADQGFIDKNRKTLQNFIAAVDEATPITNRSREASLIALDRGIGLVGDQAKIILDQTLESGLTSRQLADPTFRLSLTPNGNYTRIAKEMLDTMIGMGLVKNPPTVASLITSEIVAGMKA